MFVLTVIRELPRDRIIDSDFEDLLVWRSSDRNRVRGEISHAGPFMLTPRESGRRLMAYVEGGQSKRCRETLPSVHCVSGSGVSHRAPGTPATPAGRFKPHGALPHPFT